MDAQQGSPMMTVIMLVAFGLIFYFMIFRPQSKRNKEHKALMESLTKGTEVLTSGGLIGKITKLSTDSDEVVIALNANNEVTIKRNFIAAVLPKGSIKTLN